MQDPKIIVALDYESLDKANALLQQLSPNLCKIKIGKSMFTRFGPEFVKAVIALGFSVFLDLKFHDIPEQVAGACKAAAELGAWMVNVHVAGGKAMLKAARQAIDTYPEQQRPLLTGVTLLTSLDQSDLHCLGIEDDVALVVERFALLAQGMGLDGVVCSAQEASFLRDKISEHFLLVTPGIRLSTVADDQKRTMTPKMAIEAGVDYMVIGRPVTQSSHPVEVLNKIYQDCKLEN